ncbi:hypothetical protein CSIM01_08149 [Colletotrichum simmondsii]|uniref:Uncharacterized protein n=1 Tax=Colletotrichum simmondsii TaxID=703756 RepID=A0A135SPH7_9PEZI|nr:hypothetical protein CSIM01_08149 [Colletotrichum simmondsii]
MDTDYRTVAKGKEFDPVAGSEAAFENSPGPGDRWKKEAIFEYYGEYNVHHLQAFNFVLQPGWKYTQQDVASSGAACLLPHLSARSMPHCQLRIVGILYLAIKGILRKRRRVSAIPCHVDNHNGRILLMNKFD